MNIDDKIYVAGHRGMVGSAIVRVLKKNGYNNILTRTSQELDLRNVEMVKKFFAEEKPDYVFLAAAKVGGILANKESQAEFFYDNMSIEMNVIHQSSLNGVKKLCFLGSSCIYPKFAEQPIKEDSLMTGHLEPTNFGYAVAKIAGVKMCEAYHDQFGFKYVALMPCNLFGEGDNFDLRSSHVLPALLRKTIEAKEKGEKNLVIWGTGTPRREFLYVDDLADASLFMMNHDVEQGLFNVGRDEDMTIRDLLEMIIDVVGYEGKVVHDTTKPDGTPRKLMDSSKVRELGWNHKVSLRKGVEKLHKWFLENRESFQ